MATKLGTQKPQFPGTLIQNCAVTNQAAKTSKRQAQAVIALAQAVTANAAAISEIAKALKGAEAHLGTGISVGSN